MKSLLVISALLLIGLSASASDSSIYSLIKEGRITEARDSLSHYSSASTRDGNILFYMSLIEPDAAKSASLMETSLKSSVSDIYRQEIYYRLVQYYLAIGKYSKAGNMIGEYQTTWRDGKYRDQFIRFSVLIDESSKAYEPAVRQMDKYLLEFKDGYKNQWGQIDKGRILREDDKTVGANKIFRSMSREKSGPAIPVALYALASDAVDKNHTDDAVFYYNLLRDGYPSAVGLDALIDRMSGMSTSGDSDKEAEKLTGTYYSIQVGVFSSKENARNMADGFRKYSRNVDISNKTIGNKNYFVVYVGKFSDLVSAYQFKDELESSHNEVFQVVAR